MAEKKLEVQNLKITFKTDNGLVQAVRNISFDLYEGETLCIVGESGSGKSVTSKAIMGILANNAIVESGSIIYEGENLLDVSEEEFHKIRGHKIGMIFQDPLSSLNPIVRIGKQITEATLVNANKLKQRYNDLISKELMAYKNAIAHTSILNTKAKSKFLLQSNEIKKELKETQDAAVKAELKQKLANDKSELKEEIRKNNQDLSKILPDLKQKLKLRKAEARKEMAVYKKELKDEYIEKKTAAIEKANLEEKKANYLAEVQTINSQFNSQISSANTPEEKQKLLATKKEKLAAKKATYDECVAQLDDELKQINIEYIAKTKVTRAEAKRRAIEIMKEVGIPLPERRFRQYPFEFSGGMRQRIVIAIALTADPDVLICDEPTTALDVTIQAQILELINKLKRERNLSCIFITHDLGVVANMADRVAVMYAGKIVEYGLSNEIFFEPKHPYTWALLSSIPDVDSKERLDAIPGTPPDMIYPPTGDAFALRSKYAMQIDFKYQPPFFKVSDTHFAATWLLHPDAPKVEMPKIVSERINNALGTKKAKETIVNVEENVEKENAPKKPKTSTKTTKKKSNTKSVKGASSNE